MVLAQNKIMFVAIEWGFIAFSLASLRATKYWFVKKNPNKYNAGFIVQWGEWDDMQSCRELNGFKLFVNLPCLHIDKFWGKEITFYEKENRAK